MNMKFLLRKMWILALPAMFLVTSCDDLEVENLNAASIDDVLGNPGDFPSLIEGTYIRWWRAIQQDWVGMPYSVMSQGGSSSWGNWGMQDLGTIPRTPVQNTLTYGNRFFMNNPWANLNGALGQINEVLRVMNDNFDGQAIDPATGEDNTNFVLANAKTVQGLALGHLALFFDQAYPADESYSVVELAELDFAPYTEIAALAVQKLEEAAAIYEADPSVVMREIPGEARSGADAARFCRSYAAKILAYSSRDANETASQVDWAKVLQLSSNGLQSDFAPQGDGGTAWWTRLLVNGQLALWMRASQRLVNEMEGGNQTTAPYPWPTGTSTLPRITSPRDARLNDYFTYNSGQSFQAARGWHFFGNYNFSREADYLTAYATRMPHLTFNESELLRAEAILRTGGSKATAAEIINRTRVGNGGIAPLTGAESVDQLLREITYERLVEFSWDAAGSSWFFRRTSSANDLQLLEGTPRHLPVPAFELDLKGISTYTYGGAGNER